MKKEKLRPSLLFFFNLQSFTLAEHHIPYKQHRISIIYQISRLLTFFSLENLSTQQKISSNQSSVSLSYYHIHYLVACVTGNDLI